MNESHSDLDQLRLESEQDVDEILKLAVRAASQETAQSLRDRLIESAKELNIPDEILLKAVEVQKLNKARAANAAEKRREEARGFLAHVSAYLCTCLFLVCLDYLTDRGVSWSILAAMGWGIALFIHFLVVYVIDREKVEG